MDREQFFYRIAVFANYEGEIGLVNVHEGNNFMPLDDWLGSIVSLADGQHTIGDFINLISSQYPSGPPADLEKHIEEMIQHLIDIQAIRLTNEAVEMPYYLSMPAEEQDIDKAKKLMIEDGYISQHH